jgi:hypothetical protein
MNSDKVRIRKSSFILIGAILLLLAQKIPAYEIFIYRPYIEKKPLFKEGKLYLHGELFGQLQIPSTFPSFNDRSGKEDRWNYGFRNIVFLTDGTSILAQLVTHDDGHIRTKFDWHFSLRQYFLKNLVLIVGHDSNHDSDYQSLFEGNPYFTNRNYIGFGVPIEGDGYYFEPFTWFFHHSNQRGHLDSSGNTLRQEYGIRIGAWISPTVSLSLQALAQSEAFFALGESYLVDFIIRAKLTEWLELSIGASVMEDIKKSKLGDHKRFYKFIWGIAAPF